jgi:hypothetical protein
MILAFRVFFAVLFSGDTAARVARALAGDVVAASEKIASPAPVVEPKPRPEPKRPVQSEAITLLATLQREARLVDFLKEDLTNYSDDQVGAAARAIHQDAAKVLDRLFSLEPVVTDDEGAPVNVPAGFDAARFRLTGKVSGAGPFRGTLRHHGWQAARCDVPVFTGGDSGARTVAPADVEVN